MENQELFMIANRIQTPDGTILWSRYRHDYVAYDDAKNVTLQKVIVDVVDLVKPVIVQKNTIRTRYNNSLDEDAILACFDISDASDIEIKLDIENYLKILKMKLSSQVKEILFGFVVIVDIL